MAQLLDRVVNLIEGMDIGIRIGELPDSSMKAISVGYVRRVVCASPAYLRTHGIPQVPADLANCTIIGASPVTAFVDWRFSSGKKTICVKVTPRPTITSNEAAIIAAVEGFGITRLLSYQIAPYLVSGQPKAKLVDYEPPRYLYMFCIRNGGNDAFHRQV